MPNRRVHKLGESIAVSCDSACVLGTSWKLRGRGHSAFGMTRFVVVLRPVKPPGCSAKAARSISSGKSRN